ncbi:MAG: hypothetical protein GX259_04155 [Bacteroidales bacterium]|nr:hypothetical protein [Bacteroidales bacterium]
MKNILTILFLLSFVFVNAQVSFYLRPEVNLKSTNSYFTDNKSTSIQNEYFTFIYERTFLNFNNLNAGINVGLRLNNKHSFELGVSTNNLNTKSGIIAHRSYIIDSTNVKYKIPTESNFSFTKGYTRISFLYNYLLWKNPANTINVRGAVGFGTLFNRRVSPKKGVYTISNENGIGFSDPLDSIQMSHTVQILEYHKNSLYYNFGLGVDFFTKKNKNLFSIDVSYMHGFRRLQVNTNRINVTDGIKNANYIYSYGVSYKGSGFYIGISKKINLYTIKPSIKN